MTEITLSVPSIHCHHCKMAIEGTVGLLAGVGRAAVDVPSATVALSFEAPATLDQIVAAIEGQGYSVPARA
ncbi:MAG: cation transporter [Actinomycetota bacterium]